MAAATTAQLIEQVVALNASIAEINQRFEGANQVIAAQAQRIQQLKSSLAAGGTGPAYAFHDPNKRSIDVKVLTPESVNPQEESKRHEWSEEFTEYIESVNDPPAQIRPRRVCIAKAPIFPICVATNKLLELGMPDLKDRDGADPGDLHCARMPVEVGAEGHRRVCRR